MAGLKIYYAGEGRTELGDCADLPQNRSEPPMPGVLMALVDRVAKGPTTVAGARKWKDLGIYQGPGKSEGVTNAASS